MSIPSSGSSTWRNASLTSSFVGTSSSLAAPCPSEAQLLTEQADLFAALADEEVNPVDEAHPVAACAHHQRVRPGAVGEKADAAQQVAVGDTRRDGDHLAGSE